MHRRIYKPLLIWTWPLALMAAPLHADQDTLETQKNFHLLLRVGYQAGHVMPTNDFVKGINRNLQPIVRFESARIELGWQSDGSSPWMQLYNYPQYGFGINVAGYNNKRELGTPVSYYGWFTWPLKRWSRWAINWDSGMGLATNWQPYGVEANPYNVSFGSTRSVYLDLGFNLNFMLARNLDLRGGLTYTHFSNGTTKLPNDGINTIAPMLMVQYNFRGDGQKFITEAIPKFKANNEIQLALGGGVKSVLNEPTEIGLVDSRADRNFVMANLQAAIARQISYKSKFSIGSDVTYDGTSRVQASVIDTALHLRELPGTSYWSLGFFVGYELVVDRVSVPFNVGYYVLRDESARLSPSVYHRFGFKYHFLENTFAGVSFRLYEQKVADWMEWTIGHRWRWGGRS